MSGEQLLVWSIRAAVACYIGRLLIDASAQSPAKQSWARWLWTIGFAAYVIHVAAAFHFIHHWSHDSAYRHTAEQTKAMTGFDSGAGLYVNYAFTLLWAFDVLGWWTRGLDWARRSKAYYWTVQGAFAFMMLNATVVFGPPYWKIVAGIVLVALVVLRVTRPLLRT